MRVLKILPSTSVDGPGLRTSVYFAGCTLHCPGCHNPSSWDRSGGEEISVEELCKKLLDEGSNVTFSGGDPLLQGDDINHLAIALHDKGANIWCYTGRLFEDVVASGNYNGLLSVIDVMVDGPFIESRLSPSLPFRGSDNQRLVDVAKWREAGEIILWKSNF